MLAGYFHNVRFLQVGNSRSNCKVKSSLHECTTESSKTAIKTAANPALNSRTQVLKNEPLPLSNPSDITIQMSEPRVGKDSETQRILPASFCFHFKLIFLVYVTLLIAKPCENFLCSVHTYTVYELSEQY